MELRPPARADDVTLELSTVGRKNMLILTEELTLSDSVALTSGFVVNKIEGDCARIFV